VLLAATMAAWRTKIIYAGDSQLTALLAESGLRGKIKPSILIRLGVGSRTQALAYRTNDFAARQLE
jgi:hypothetical protein